MALLNKIKFIKFNEIKNIRQYAIAMANSSCLPKAQTHYGGRHTVTLIPGTGIGPELMKYVKEIFSFMGAPVDFEEVKIDYFGDSKNELDNAVLSVLRNGVALKSNLNSRPCDSLCSIEQLSNNAQLRERLQLFVNSVHCTSFPNLSQLHKNVDVLVIRQNTEGEYAMLEHETVRGVVESLKVVSRKNAERVIRYAFNCAKLNNRKTVTTVHKANIMKLSDGYFLNLAREIATEYPNILHNDMIVDAACMRLVSDPGAFDVILTTNLYGSIVSNLLCGLVGGPGLVSGRNLGEHCVTFEPACRATGHELVGRNLANPIAMLNASADLLSHLGHEGYAVLLRQGIAGSIRQGVRTKDVGGRSSSREVIDSIMGHIELAGTNATIKD